SGRPVRGNGEGRALRGQLAGEAKPARRRERGRGSDRFETADPDRARFRVSWLSADRDAFPTRRLSSLRSVYRGAEIPGRAAAGHRRDRLNYPMKTLSLFAFFLASAAGVLGAVEE